ncbi:MAG: ligase-associated DNA damage response endonuclease PdeM [Flavobacteriaceae bacterium]|nr:ligase-associated DNA damage response endonuclease PdeM [Flavobacteriaceae bacterium]
MSIVTKSIRRKGETLILTNQRALYWPSHKTLILSDLHIGKAGHFRKHGIAIPKDVLEADLNRLQMVMEFFSTTSLMVVGDLFHAGTNCEFGIFKNWMNEIEGITIDLIKGNHDRLKLSVYEDLGILLYKPVKHVPPFTFVHDKQPSETNAFCISGHTHPGVSLKLKGKQRIKLPCYQLTKDSLILPAFSRFTGLNTRTGGEDTICYAFTDTDFIKL